MLTQHTKSGAIYDWPNPHLQSHAYYVIGPLPPPPEQQLIQASDAVVTLSISSMYFLFSSSLLFWSPAFFGLSSFLSCPKDVFLGGVLIIVRLIRLPF
ncbi:uncharacterized protein EURHEDRAFT_271967 [Aspergillus ruber CBS 135680]|uniref:Uncharacterized protein n=1 Tax=Aspergillus ruber (strain CBS 135680) TaxID=1388766 RepID=A0A017SMJ2_ASPRC|nr:uncharacterized protein EURHEDRAFT_271967 [Aspergillus ruber CBS 135680]EYE98162.1 hypothetical protein EURHEDRAFT_271967 [Aspergillus ruber CBS 135680]